MGEIQIPPWGVVVLGRWNKSILTPIYVMGKLLGHQPDFPLEIQVPANAHGPLKIKDAAKGVMVSVEEERLFIEADKNNYDAVAVALAAAATAIDDLPRTPLSAAGVTMVFDLSAALEGAPTGTNKQWDKALADKHYEVIRHLSARMLRWDKARIYVISDREEDNSGIVVINFELRSVDAIELSTWLKTPIGEFKTRAEEMLACMRAGGIS